MKHCERCARHIHRRELSCPFCGQPCGPASDASTSGDSPRLWRVAAALAAAAAGASCASAPTTQPPPPPNPPLEQRSAPNPVDASIAIAPEAALVVEAPEAGSPAPEAASVETTPPLPPPTFSHKYACPQPKTTPGPLDLAALSTGADSGTLAGYGPPPNSEEYRRAQREAEDYQADAKLATLEPCLEKFAPATSRGQWAEVLVTYHPSGSSSSVDLAASTKLTPALLGCLEQEACKWFRRPNDQQSALTFTRPPTRIRFPLTRWDLVLESPTLPEVAKTLAPKRSALLKCFRPAIRSNPNSDTEVRLRIEPQGSDWRVLPLSSSTSAGPEVLPCLRVVVPRLLRSPTKPDAGATGTDLVVRLVYVERRVK